MGDRGGSKQQWWAAAGRYSFIYEAGSGLPGAMGGRYRAHGDRKLVTGSGVEGVGLGCVCVWGGQGGGQIDRWDPPADRPHLPRLSINVQPRVCGYSESVCFCE